MPPDLLQFLLAQQIQSGGGGLGGGGPLGGGGTFGSSADFLVPPFRGGPGPSDPFGGIGLQASQLGQLPDARTLQQPAPPPVGAIGGAGLEGFNPNAGLGALGGGALVPQPLGATTASQLQTGGQEEQGRSFLQILGDIVGGAGAGLAGSVARARLGGGGGGGAAPGTGGAASFPGAGRVLGGGQPGISGAQTAQVVNALGLQQQADVAQQRQLSADLLGSLIGGIGGGIAGGIGGGGGGGGAAPAVAPGAGSVGGIGGLNPQLSAGSLGFVR